MIPRPEAAGKRQHGGGTAVAAGYTRNRATALIECRAMNPETIPSHPAPPNTADGVPPDPATMFPKPDPAHVEQTEDASVGIEDPRTETAAPDSISAPYNNGR